MPQPTPSADALPDDICNNFRLDVDLGEWRMSNDSASPFFFFPFNIFNPNYILRPKPPPVGSSFALAPTRRPKSLNSRGIFLLSGTSNFVVADVKRSVEEENAAPNKWSTTSYTQQATSRIHDRYNVPGTFVC